MSDILVFLYSWAQFWDEVKLLGNSLMLSVLVFKDLWGGIRTMLNIGLVMQD